ncbi:MAG TPA: SpoIIE family protein phosphatase [candidate division Zixibacteria bacterium]|nr:SpoIIE family protein phosphatase [candidate division Zixibacteria bacterium]
MLKLIGTDGKRFYSFTLEPGKYTVGRKEDCSFCVNDRTVSRQHAEIEVGLNSSEVLIRDLGSHNGTCVNGVRVNGNTVAHKNDLVMFGQVEFRLADTEEITKPETKSPTTTQLAQIDPQQSVVLDIKEALRPLPSKVSDIPELWSTLSEMARMLVLPEPKETMLQRSLSLVSKVIPAERLAVLSTSPDRVNVYTDALLLLHRKEMGTFTLSKTIVNEILTNKSSILIGDPSDDPRFSGQQSIVASDLKSAMAVPLFDEGKVLGILYADTTNPLHRYSNDYLRLFATFGNIIASRLLNYTLLTERQEKEKMEAELTRASNIQKNLLAKQVPQLPGYSVHPFQEQCQAVGGDLYDIALLPDGRLVFIVADVSGKGMGAALLMSNILASFRIQYSDPDFDLVKAVRHVSLQLHKYTAAEDFATLFVGIVDAKNHTMTYINAGHNPPLIAKNDGSCKYLNPSGTMIGAFDFSDWQSEKAEFVPGDLLFVFTDGVSEATNKENQYGEERMQDVIVKSRQLTPARIAGALFEDIMKFVEDEPRSDDITMLIVKRES